MTKPAKPSGITRREALAGAIGTVTLAAAASGARAHTPARKPNFLFIMADDMGFADLSCYGRTEYRTPVLDSLAAQGMQFMHGYANSAVCSSTRVGLITGRYQYRLPVGLEEPLSNPDLGLEPGLPVLPLMLKRQGYHTALVGKWHMGNLPRFGPLQSGYDEFWGNRGGGVDYFTHAIAGRADLWDGDVQVDEHGYYTDLLADRSIEYLEARAQEADKPWLLSLHFTAAHWPWEGNNDKGRAESERLSHVTGQGGDLNIVHYDGGDMATYGEMVTSLDMNVGRILGRLRELGMDRETVVVFTSDNGGERFSNTWPFTGKKTELLEGGLRVPLIVRWPGITAPGSTTDVPAISMDWFPTFLAAAGGQAPADSPFDGVDLLPVLMGESLPQRDLFWRYKSKDQKAIRRGEMKYLKIGPNEFLFNVVADPLERANLKERQPEVFAALKAAHDEWDSQMLHDPNARSYGMDAAHMADHYDWHD